MIRTEGSLSTEKVRVRAYRADLDTTVVHLEDVRAPSMAISQILSPEASPIISQSGSPPHLSPSLDLMAASFAHEKSKRHSYYDRSRQLSPTISEGDTSLHPSGPTSNGDHAAAEWSSAVGRATTGGKSGRVIERLMNDNDTLRREKKVAIVKLEEETKRGESARAAVEALQLSNANLTSMHESDVSLLHKRDRRILQLRDDLDAERARRESAERETRDTRKEREDTIDRMRRETMEDKQQCLKATSQYDVLSKSWKSLEQQHLKQVEGLRKDLEELRCAMEKDKEKLARMEIIMEQAARESERLRSAKEKLSTDFQRYKSDQEADLREMRQRAASNDIRSDETHQEMQDTLERLKWALNVQRDFRTSI